MLNPSKSFVEPENRGEAENALITFRAEWAKELNNPPIEDGEQSLGTPTVEEEAEQLFLHGEELEKKGRVFEALKFYSRAVQLEPDIESRLNPIVLVLPKSKVEIYDSDEDLTEDEEETGDENENEENEGDEEDEDLLEKIEREVGESLTVCVPKYEQGATHISALPREMILNILRWVVSSELDARSLEMCSMVCRGFYLCARDSEIWRIACLRVWGLKCGETPRNYLSWRDMFLHRPNLNFNGCYISKSSYVRHGVNTFEQHSDQFNVPWHLVTYYRYLRFFPDGVVLVLTSSDDPAKSVTELRDKNGKYPILRGLYRLNDNRVTLVVRRIENKGNNNAKGKAVKRKDRDYQWEPVEMTYNMEVEIQSIRNRKHNKLVWKHYSVLTRTRSGEESDCTFELLRRSFPPFWFSRVRSYTRETHSPLF